MKLTVRFYSHLTLIHQQTKSIQLDRAQKLQRKRRWRRGSKWGRVKPAKGSWRQKRAAVIREKPGFCPHWQRYGKHGSPSLFCSRIASTSLQYSLLASKGILACGGRNKRPIRAQPSASHWFEEHINQITKCMSSTWNKTQLQFSAVFLSDRTVTILTQEWWEVCVGSCTHIEAPLWSFTWPYTSRFGQVVPKSLRTVSSCLPHRIFFLWYIFHSFMWVHGTYLCSGSPCLSAKPEFHNIHHNNIIY